jgi:hypothetical protein
MRKRPAVDAAGTVACAAAGIGQAVAIVSGQDDLQTASPAEMPRPDVAGPVRAARTRRASRRSGPASAGRPAGLPAWTARTLDCFLHVAQHRCERRSTMGIGIIGRIVAIVVAILIVRLAGIL